MLGSKYYLAALVDLFIFFFLHFHGTIPLKFSSAIIGYVNGIVDQKHASDFENSSQIPNKNGSRPFFALILAATKSISYTVLYHFHLTFLTSLLFCVLYFNVNSHKHIITKDSMMHGYKGIEITCLMANTKVGLLRNAEAMK